ncbi:Mce protein [Williamsia sp. R60]
MADHDDARGTLTDPAETQDKNERNSEIDTSSPQRDTKARVVRRKPVRLGAIKRKATKPVQASAEDIVEVPDDLKTKAQPNPAETPAESTDGDAEIPEAEGTDSEEPTAEITPRIPAWSTPTGRLARLLAPRALVAALVALLAIVACTSAVLQWRELHDEKGARSERQAFLQAGRQGALNLTTIRWDNADSDVQRILDGAGDPFRKDFADRSKSFIAVVKEAKSTSTGEITEAGLETVEGNSAQVIVSATVKTANVGAAEQEPRAWRMKVRVEKKDNRMFVTNVEFVP